MKFPRISKRKEVPYKAPLFLWIESYKFKTTGSKGSY